MEPIGILISIGSALLAGGVSWGLLKGDVKALEKEQANLKTELDKKASKELVDGMDSRLDDIKADLDRRLDIIENLLRHPHQ